MRLVATILLSLLALGTAVARADQTTGSRLSQLAPLPTWTGFYAGVNAGGLWNSPNATAVDWSRLTLPPSDFQSRSIVAAGGDPGSMHPRRR